MKEMIEKYKNDEILNNCTKIINIMKNYYDKGIMDYKTYDKIFELITNIVEERIRYIIFWEEK